jgi:hypothetical protein
MKLLGEWNRYVPRWLEWLPRLEPSDSDRVSERRPTAVSA